MYCEITAAELRRRRGAASAIELLARRGWRMLFIDFTTAWIWLSFLICRSSLKSVVR